MAPNISSTSTEQALIPFTGYYTLDANSGAFLMIDTSMAGITGPDGARIDEYFATVSYSPDGQTSMQFRRSTDLAVTGSQLAIKGPDGTVVADLNFTNTTGNMSVSGTFLGKEVSGSTPFGPVRLAIWSGTYYQQGPSTYGPAGAQYTFTPTLQINADGQVLFASGDGLQPVESYWYDFAMFVIRVPNQENPAQPHLYEMGTSSGWGRVAGNAEHGSMLVSIRQQVLVPIL